MAATNTVQTILDIRVNSADAIQNIIKYKDELSKVKMEQKTLREELVDGIKTQDEYNSAMMKQVKREEELRQAIQTNQRVLRANVKEQKNLEGSLDQLRGSLSKATAAYDKMSREERNSAKGQELQQHIKDITKELKGAEEETERFYRNVGNYENSIKSAIFGNSQFGNSLMNISDSLGEGGMSGMLNNAKAQIGGFGKALGGLMANPYFLAIAGIAGAGAAFKWWWDYNTGLEEASRLTQHFTGQTGEQMRATRSDVQGVADMFGKDFKEVLEATNSMSKQFGIDFNVALKYVEEGFLRGGDASGEMLSNISEYSTHFAEAGLAADDLMQISIAATKQGVFSDKGLDAVKEANVKLREMPKATQEALSALGLDVNKIMSDLESGTTTTFEVMQQVAGKLDEIPPDSAVAGQAIADIFGGPGEEAGLAYLQTLNDINTDLDITEEKSDEVTEARRRQLDAEQELDRAVAALFDRTGGGFESMKSNIKTVTNKFLTGLVKGVINVVNYFIDLYNNVIFVRAAVATIATTFKTVGSAAMLLFNLLKTAIEAIAKQFKGLGTIISGVFTGDLDAINRGWNEFTRGFKEQFSKYGNELKNFVVNVKSAFAEADNMVRNSKLNKIKQTGEVVITESTSGGGGGGGTGKDKGKGGGGGATKGGGSNRSTSKKSSHKVDKDTQDKIDAAKKAADEAKKAEEEAYKAAMDALREQVELYELTLANQEIYDQKSLDMTIAKYEVQRAMELAEAERSIQNEDIKKQTLLQINKKYDSAILEEETNFYAAEFKKRSEAAQETLASEIETLEEELEATRMSKDKKLATLEELRNRELELNELKKEERLREIEDMVATEEEKNKLMLQAEEEFAKNAVQINRDSSEETKRIVQEAFEKKVSYATAAASVLNGLTQLTEAFGEENKKAAKAAKAIAMGEIAVNTGVAIARGVKEAQAAGPFPANIVAIATTITTILANMASAISTVKSAKFAHGGLVSGAGTGTSDSIPARLSNGESVMTAAATSMFAPALSAFNQIGGGVPIVVHSPAEQMGQEFLAAAVAKGMAAAPAPVVSVEEIDRVGRRVKALERLGTL